VHDDDDDGLDEKEFPDASDTDDEDDDSDLCPQCGREIYHDATVCPHCGEMISHGPVFNSRSPLVVVVVLILLGVMLYGILRLIF